MNRRATRREIKGRGIGVQRGSLWRGGGASASPCAARRHGPGSEHMGGLLLRGEGEEPPGARRPEGGGDGTGTAAGRSGRGRRSSSEQCINLASRQEENISVQPGSLANMTNLDKMDNLVTETEGAPSFGFRLKRSLTVSHIIDNFNKSFRVKRSQSQREVTPRKGKIRCDFRSHMVARALLSDGFLEHIHDLSVCVCNGF